jgi:predicted O-methyltransferase YrrM
MDASANYAASQIAGTIIFIGAGRCHELADLLTDNLARLILVEPQPRLAQELRRRTAGHPNVEVIEAAVAPGGAPTRLKVFNIPELSSLRKPTGLYDAFPGLKVVNEFEVDILAPDLLIDWPELQPGQGNQLILDAPGEETAIMQALLDANRAAVFERIDMISGRTALFETDPTGTELLDRLADEDYDIDQYCEAAADSERVVWRIRRNHLRAENPELREKQESERERLDRKLKSQESRLQEKLEKVEENLSKRIEYSSGNSTKQLEAFIGLINNMNSLSLPPVLHGWPISADFALHLVRLIKGNDYDLVVEFGSGSSTQIMADALAQKLNQQMLSKTSSDHAIPAVQRPETVASGAGKNLSPLTTGQSMEAVRKSKISAKRIITFEHDHKYLDQTAKELSLAGLDNFVDLTYAPLQDYVTLDGEHFKYYSCEQKLAAIAREVADKAQYILVVVDGPPGNTGKHARYPALPVILQNLPGYNYDILLDDFIRKEEKEIVKRWTKLLNKQSITFKKIEMPFEKGACQLSIT